MKTIALALFLALLGGCMDSGSIAADAAEPDAMTWPAKIAGYWTIQFPDKGAPQCGSTTSMNFDIAATVDAGNQQLAIVAGSLVSDTCRFVNVSADGSAGDLECVSQDGQFYAHFSDNGQTAAVLVTSWGNGTCSLDDSATGGHGAQATIVTRQR